jgi:two-component system chemotaxis response regulator CheY
MIRILVVDDALMVRRQVRAALEAAGFTVLEARDGAEALEQLDAFPETSLIVSDVHMPNMNGFELLERLVARGSSIPVVMLTAEAESNAIQRAKALGAKGWLVKPLNPEFLVATAKKVGGP